MRAIPALMCVTALTAVLMVATACRADTELTTTTPTPTPEPGPTVAAPDVYQASGEHTDHVLAIAAELDGLPIDEFLDRSYRELMLRHPEHLTALGLSEAYGLRDDSLDDLSDEYVSETYDLVAAILDELREYDRDSLSPSQATSFEVYEWYLDNELRGREFKGYSYPVNQFINSHHDGLIRLFTEYHVVDDVGSADDFVVRLNAVDRQMNQVIDGLKESESMGIVAPDFILRMARGRIEADLGIANGDVDTIDVDRLPVFTAFEEQVYALPDADDDRKSELIADARAATTGSFIPAYGALLDHIDHMEQIATSDAGAWKLPRGDEYYRYVLRTETSTDLTPDEVHDLGLAEVARIQSEMQTVFDELGYSADASLAENMERAIRDGGSFNLSTQAGKEQYLHAFEDIIAEVDASTGDVFNERPSAALEVVGGDYGGFYVPAAIDGSRPGAFHVGLTGGYAPRFNMASLAYHEAVPGHHFQIAIAQELDLPALRSDIGFNAYTEGWALYAERLAWEMGLYDDDPYGNLGRLQFELLRAVRLVVDTGIHAKRWTPDEARDYMAEALGDPAGRWAHEVERYVVMPGQATGYKIGMLRLLELRERAETALGDRFDLADFHSVILGSGSMPLDVLESVVDDYVADNRSTG